MAGSYEMQDLSGRNQEHRHQRLSLEESSRLVEPISRENSLQEGSVSDTSPELSYGGKVYRTGCACAAYFSVALSLGILGPSLPDFEQITGASTSQVSMVFLCRGLLAIFGSLLLGPVLDRVDHYLIVGLALLGDFVLHGAVPWCRNLGALLATLAPPEFFNCAIGMGTHLICLDVWKDDAGPSLQLLNLVSVLGFMGAPLMVSPFLSEDLCHHSNGSQGCETNTGNVTDIIRNVAYQEWKESAHEKHYDVSLNHIEISNVTMVTEPSSKVHFAYVVVALYSLLVAGFVTLALLLDGGNILKSKFTQAQASTADDSKRTTKKFSLQVSMLFFVFNIFYGGLEVGYAGLVMTFAVRYLGWNKGTGAYVTALVQGSNAIITAAAIVFSKYIHPQVILLWDIVIIIASMVLLTTLINIYPVILWVSTAMLGAGYATVMPSSFTWAQSFMQVTGNFSGVYWCGYFTGFMAVPALAGYLFDRVHNMWFVYVMLGCGIGMASTLLLLRYVVNNRTRSQTAAVKV